MIASAPKRILVLTRYYLPGSCAGGPIKSVSNLVNALGKEFSFHIITSDRDIGDGERYLGIVTGSWVTLGMARVMYLKKDIFLPFKLLKIIRSGQFDLIYLNSFFDPCFSIIPMLINRLSMQSRSSVLLASRGELSFGALGLKRMKKLFYIRFAKVVNLYKGIVWHASTSNESNDIRRVFSLSSDSIATARVISASDIASLGEFSKPDGQLNLPSGNIFRICFLSRISRMKNLSFVLEVLKKVQIQVELSIYGPLEDIEYWNLCQHEIKSLPTNIKTHYLGPVAPSDVVKTIAAYDLFFLPTLGENYGHVIVEAWSAGVPVLISDQTPWRNLRERSVGWDLPLSSLENFKDALLEVSQWSREYRNHVRLSCHQEAISIINNQSVIADNRMMLLNAMDSHQDDARYG